MPIIYVFRSKIRKIGIPLCTLVLLYKSRVYKGIYVTERFSDIFLITAQYGPYYLPLNVFTVSKGSNFNLYFICYYYSWRCAVLRP